MSERRCANCLAPAGADCPHWIGPEDGILETNDLTGEQRLFVGCSCGAFLARMTRYIIQTNSAVAAAAESSRNDLVATLDRLSRQIDMSRKSVLKALQDATRDSSRAEVLEHFADFVLEKQKQVRGPNGA